MKKRILSIALAFAFVLASAFAFIPAAAYGMTVVWPSQSKVFVNGSEKSFEAYYIDGYNYFKLRDLAYVLNGTDKQFSVGYDGATRAITLTSGRPYSPAGGEMAAAGGGARTAGQTPSKIRLDGKELNFTAYNIGGNNFFRLRDLMGALDVAVTYDDATQNIGIDTSLPYDGDSGDRTLPGGLSPDDPRAYDYLPMTLIVGGNADAASIPGGVAKPVDFTDFEDPSQIYGMKEEVAMEVLYSIMRTARMTVEGNDFYVTFSVPDLPEGYYVDMGVSAAGDRTLISSGLFFNSATGGWPNTRQLRNDGMNPYSGLVVLGQESGALKGEYKLLMARTPPAKSMSAIQIFNDIDQIHMRVNIGTYYTAIHRASTWSGQRSDAYWIGAKGKFVANPEYGVPEAAKNFLDLFKI
jgi:hypothetical protein